MNLYFNPIEEAAKVDTTKHKTHDMPQIGDIFVQLHQGGTQVVFGSVIGLDIRFDRTGEVIGWKASIDSGFRPPGGLTNGATWRDASEWHPAPPRPVAPVVKAREVDAAPPRQAGTEVPSAATRIPRFPGTGKPPVNDAPVK